MNCVLPEVTKVGKRILSIFCGKMQVPSVHEQELEKLCLENLSLAIKRYEEVREYEIVDVSSSSITSSLPTVYPYPLRSLSSCSIQDTEGLDEFPENFVCKNLPPVEEELPITPPLNKRSEGRRAQRPKGKNANKTQQVDQRTTRRKIKVLPARSPKEIAKKRTRPMLPREAKRRK
ncbi:hypothetical protein NECAME_05337 [Necator americanus]|uniref:Uncharacterized protein n=1 Tax=Necator americanus TaxID=51031 RepID=W2SI08_NECAM|nr:hypothetical protein NECAME_05337 [Necator americanus]ETN69230.1 hypothetical protein NECAME_05337 [Necator americanus]